jgi:hypothetical protein
LLLCLKEFSGDFPMRPVLSKSALLLLLALVLMPGGSAQAQSPKKKTTKARASQQSPVKAQNPTAKQAAPALAPLATIESEGDGVRRITPAVARDGLLQGRAIIVDVRSEASYDAGHVKGARWINLNDIGAKAGELPRDKMIITYCS